MYRERNHSWPLRWFSALMLLALVLLPSPAFADNATAQALFEAGAAARETGDYATACEKFEASNDIAPAPGTILNIADCREQLGQLAQAWQRYAEAAEKFPSSDGRADYAAKKAGALKAKLPSVTLEWEADQPGGDIYLDGQQLPTSVVGVPLPVDPGDHVYVVKATDRQDASYEVSLTEGESKVLTLAVGPALQSSDEAGSAGQAGASRKEGSALKMAGFVTLGVGVASLAAGSVTGLMAMNKSKTVDDDCNDEDFCRTEEGKKAADAGRTLATVSTITFIAGGVLSAAGITLVLIASGPKEGPTAASGAIKRWQLAATPTAGGGGLRLGGSF